MPAGSDRDRAATVVVAAGAPFALTSHARARLLRQLHATGLLDGRAAGSRVSAGTGSTNGADTRAAAPRAAGAQA